MGARRARVSSGCGCGGRCLGEFGARVSLRSGCGGRRGGAGAGARRPARPQEPVSARRAPRVPCSGWIGRTCGTPSGSRRPSKRGSETGVWSRNLAAEAARLSGRSPCCAPSTRGGFLGRLPMVAAAWEAPGTQRGTDPARRPRAAPTRGLGPGSCELSSLGRAGLGGRRAWAPASALAPRGISVAAAPQCSGRSGCGAPALLSQDGCVGIRSRL